MKNNTLVDIVICVYNRFDLLQQCLDSIPASVDGAFEYNIILVDNGSQKEAAKDFYYSLDKSNITVVYNNKNLGFPSASNRGAARKSSPLILMLNSDIILTPESLKILVKEMDDPKVAIAGMKLLFPHDVADKRLYTGIRPAGKVQHVGLTTNIIGELFHIFVGWDSDHPKVNSIHDVYMVTGAVMLIRRSVWTKIGGFYLGYGLGCLVGDTLIFTENGIQRLDKLSDGVPVKVSSEVSVQEANYFHDNGIYQTLQVELQKNFYICGTPNHKVRYMSSKGKIEWEEIGNLSIGDFVAVRKNTQMFGTSSLSYNDAYLLGAYIANGSNERQGRITISSGHSYVGEFLQKNYGFSCSRKYHYRKQDKNLYNFVFQYVDKEWKSLTKEIPPIILSSDKATQIAFLRGLFDGDGCAVKDGRVTYSSSSLLLIKQLQMMLLNFGCVVGYSIRYSKLSSNPNYLVDFGGDSAQFYSEIGFDVEQKQANEKYVRPTRSTLIPYQQVYLKELYDMFPKDKPEDLHVNLIRKHVRKATIDKFLAYGKTIGLENSSSYAQLESNIDNEFVWLQVKAIENTGCLPTFDLHVPETNAYVANGVVVHNTYEDAELCLSARKMGYNIVVNTKAIAYHYVGATAESYNIAYPLNANKLTFLQRNASLLVWDEYKYW